MSSKLSRIAHRVKALGSLWRRLGLAAALAPIAALLAAMPAIAETGSDWPYWRGPEMNGISRETGLVDDFDPKGGEGSNVAWVREDLGGRSTPVVLDGKLYTIVRDQIGTPKEGEKVVCIDAKTGKDIWSHGFNVYLSDVPDTRVGWSSVVADPETKRVYALGVCGLFMCLEGETGKVVWQRSLHEEFGLLSTYGGRTNFPIIHEDLVIISAVVIGWGDMAKPAHRFLGMNKATGEVVWFNGTRELPYDTTYSAPVLATFNGQKALVFGSGDGAVWAFQPRTGKPIWQFRFSRRGLNVSPTVDGDTVYTGHSEENIIGTAMGAVVAINGALSGDLTQRGRKWLHTEYMVGKSSPVVVDGRLYAVDDRAKMHVFDTKTGRPVKRMISVNRGRVMRSSLLYADGKIYAFTAGRPWAILEPDKRRGVKEVSSGLLLPGEECHASPIASHGRVYVQTTGRLYCLADKSKTAGMTETPQLAAEKPVDADPKPAHVQLVPAELLLKPGEQQKYTVRLFNANGQFLKETSAEFELEGPGSITPDGAFTASTEGSVHAATIVKARVGDLVGRARVRIVPPLPWKFDFENVNISPTRKAGEPPITWVGARYRHVVREMDGSKVMVKVTTIPKGTRSRSWMGHPELSNYTIQADVKSAEQEGKMADIGLIAQRYTLDLQGQHQKVQVRSWSSTLRMAKEVPFKWEANKWYVMKFKVSVQGDKALVQGKVWPKGEAEPDAWTIEAEDPRPNLQGSPGLYGSAKDAELYLDNITVTPNSSS